MSVSNSINFLGSYSGITSETIDSLIAAQSGKLTQYNNQKESLTKEKTAWSDIQTRLTNLNTKMDTLMDPKSFFSKKTTSSDETKLAVSAGTNAVSGQYEITVERLASASRLTSGQILTTGQTNTTALGFEGTFKLSSQDTSEIGASDPKTLKQVDITISNTDSLKDVITKINAQTKDSGISATIIDGRLSLTDAQLGDRTISVTSATDLADKLALNPAAAGIAKVTLAAGTSAKVTVNNTITLERNSNTITDAIEGMTLNLKATTASPVSVSVADDTDNTLKVVKDFVEQYNSTVSFITEKLSVGNPTSTTNVSGALSGDSTLMRLQSSLRQMLTGGVEIQKMNPSDPDETQKFDFIGSLGISVDRYGKASIDETKLKEVITKEPDRVAGFFSRSITVDGTTEKKKVGLAEKLQTVVNSFVDSKDGMITAKNKTYDKAMDDIAKKIEAFNVRMEAQRARYVKTFTALDTAMMQAESQMSYLSSQLTSSND
ncbi:flagellar filament capping protein FliD [Trichococcus shcherbakoviae]|uniref:Flagellar hook-associated protein 2 n=1 Tax=Trichococcus shcherbakoviae subsp. psychrophilus TaxID=2585775 RepID=A0A5C5E705_9LACT|nr:flagellar filament capping protein FliD [Trichococcus shcherbakoviae]TNV68579.1 flagellar hook protein [Trichococcus shcherbakoviae subsp. psychrophilus]